MITYMKQKKREKQAKCNCEAMKCRGLKDDSTGESKSSVLWPR